MAAPWLVEGALTELINQETNFIEKSTAIAADVQNRTLELVTLVERLGPVLTDVKPEIRERGTRILANVLQNLPQDFLLEKELQFIALFFSDRLQDHHSVIPATLQGILAISDMTNLEKSDICRLVTAMFRHAQCQSQLQRDRNCYYQIISCFIHKATKELQDMGADFVFGMLSAMDGERDPRNLMMLFQMLPELLSLFPLDHLAEDMFEVMACYFPIDFHSPSSDPDSVTRDDLATALIPCLTARPEFAPYCLPLVLEKLDSSLRVAKTDCLITLRACSERFRVTDLERYLSEMWSSLKLEVLPGGDAELQTLGLSTLCSLARRLSDEHSELVPKLLDNVLAAGRDALRQVDLSLFSPAVSLLTVVASASHSTCLYITAQVIPLLSSQCLSETRSEHRASILSAITGLLKTCHQFGVVPAGVAGLYELYSSAEVNTALKIERLLGTAALLPFLNEVQRSEVYRALAELVHEEESHLVRQELDQCLRTAAQHHSDEVLLQLVSSHLSVEHPQDLVSTTLSHRVAALCTLAQLHTILPTVAPQVLLLVTDAVNLYTCKAGLQGLKQLVTEGSDATNSFLYTKCDCISRLVSWWVDGLSLGTDPQIFHDVSLLEDLALVVYHILRTQPLGIQNDVVRKLTPRFFESDPSTFQPLSSNSPIQQTRAVLLLEGIISAMRREVQIPMLVDMTRQLVELTDCSTDVTTRLGAARLLSIVVNKTVDPELVATLLDVCQNACKGPLVVTWLAKALIMRGHPAADSMLTSLVTLLASAEVGHEAARGFHTLLATTGDYLNSKSHCNIRVLYKQRLFLCAPALSAQARAAPTNLAVYYHEALAQMLHQVPQDILTADIHQTVTLLVECLLVDEEMLLQAVLETLAVLAQAVQPLLADHLATLVPRCLRLSQAHVKMKVRIAAVECIHHFTNYSTILLLPFKKDVIVGLAASVDDRKRLVRRAAMLARTRWFLVGAPGEPKSS